jgi:hypothetical protein
VSQNQIDQETEAGVRRGREAVAAAETLRSSAESSQHHHKPAEKKDEEKMSLFWRVFGGTILSITALGVITLYNNLSSGIADLRAELSKEREARAELVKKDEFQSRSQALYERMRSAEAIKADVEGLREKSNTNAAAIDGVKKDTAGVEVLRERLNTVTAELKTAREDVQKLQAELEKNRTADLERKAARDTQTRQQDEAIKELQKALQDCREKLARLEGAMPPTTTRPPLPFIGGQSPVPAKDGKPKPDGD